MISEDVVNLKQIRYSTISLVLFVLSAIVSAQEARPKVAIKTFQNPANFSRSTIGDGLTDMLTTELENTGKFNVLERGQIDELTKEIDFGVVDTETSKLLRRKGIFSEPNIC
jgi:curli biogenesis system outer membrane secretion channel CsgG